MRNETGALRRNRLGDLCVQCQRLVLPLAGFHAAQGVLCWSCSGEAAPAAGEAGAWPSQHVRSGG